MITSSIQKYSKTSGDPGFSTAKWSPTRASPMPRHHRPEAVGLLEALELVREDPEVPARGPKRGQLALLDPLLDGRRRNFKHFTYFSGRQVPLVDPRRSQGAQSGG